MCSGWWGLEGLEVKSVEEGSTAEAADLRTGDTIIEVDGVYLGDLLTNQVPLGWEHNKKAGQKTVLTVMRNGNRQAIAVKADLDGALGFDFDAKNSISIPYFDYVRPDSPAGRAVVQKGDRIHSVNGTDTRGLSANAVLALLQGLLGDHMSIAIERDGNVKTIELTRGIVTDWGRALGFSSQGGGGASAERNPRWNFTNWEVKSLDWHGGIAQAVVDDLATEINNQPGMILNLSGADGNNAESAARIASHFMPEGTLIWIELADESTVRYFMHDGDLIKETITASGKNQETLSKSVPQFTGKLAVIVDGRTAGVAMAIAHSLQANKRGIVVGTGTTMRAALYGVIDVTTPDRHLLLQLPNKFLLSVDGKQFPGVNPDSIALVNVKDSALRALDGSSAWRRPEQPGLLLAALVLGAIVMVMLVGAVRNKGKTSAGDASESPVEISCTAGGEPASAPTQPVEKKPTSRAQAGYRWFCSSFWSADYIPL